MDPLRRAAFPFRQRRFCQGICLRQDWRWLGVMGESNWPICLSPAYFWPTSASTFHSVGLVGLGDWDDWEIRPGQSNSLIEFLTSLLQNPYDLTNAEIMLHSSHSRTHFSEAHSSLSLWCPMAMIWAGSLREMPRLSISVECSLDQPRLEFYSKKLRLQIVMGDPFHPIEFWTGRDE
jgi:hypothetical protein